jgi:hypothetical protein
VVPEIPSVATVNLQTMWNGAAQVVTNGASVDRWLDVRGTSYPSAYQATVGVRPVGTLRSGSAALQFNGFDSFFQLYDNGTTTSLVQTWGEAATAAQAEIFAVFEQTAATTALNGSAWYGANHDTLIGDSSSYMGMGLSAAGLAGGFFDSANNQPVNDSTGLAPLVGTRHVGRLCHNGQRIDVQLDNGTVQTRTGVGTGNLLSTGTTIRIGWNTGALYFTGYLFALVILPREATPTERASIYAKLNLEYGVTTP